MMAVTKQPSFPHLPGDDKWQPKMALTMVALKLSVASVCYS